ncbi:MAG: haloacid dehalogenase type II [Acidobacteriota bacterium]
MDDRPATVFDAYGTVFDVAAPAREVFDDPATAARVATLWRGRQLEYAWTEGSLGRAPDFWSVTGRALRSALELAGLGDDEVLHERLLAVYGHVRAYDDAAPLLAALRTRGHRLVIYSNANQDMLERSVAAAGLDEHLDLVLSVEGSGVYKPDRRAYEHVCARLGVEARTVRFVSSNAWDVAGAQHAGLDAVWVDRDGLTYPFGPPPTTVDSLGAVSA